ncbi:YqbF domain-containing protein [Heyndrickxia sporothermodurans]
MPYFAKLVNGVNYHVMGYSFTVDKEKEVTKDVFNYLQEHPQFELHKDESNNPLKDELSFEPPSPEDGLAYTEGELKKLNKAQQDAIIHALSGDMVHETKNEAERIALILKLQEEKGE